MSFRIFVSGATLAAALWSTPMVLAQTPDPDAVQAARELAEISIPTSLVDQMVEQSWLGVERMTQRASPQIPDEKLAALKAEYIKIMNEEMSSSMESTPLIFAKHLSAKEMREFVAFYKTDSGKKMLAAMPAIMQEVMESMNSRMVQNMSRFQESAARILGSRQPGSTHR